LSFSFSVGLVWRAVTGNTDNLASGRRLSINICLQRENKFSFFPCHARNPYSHKGNPRLHTRETIGKYFPAIVNSGGQSTRKAKGRNRQVVRTRDKPKRKGTERNGWEGMERKEGIQALENLLPHSIKYPQ